jgi:ubiquitin-activating enzyme E1
MSKFDKIDNNLYDRQIRTYGEEAINKITSSSVLIMGLAGGLGTEIAKNLTLGGIKNIYLFDDTIVNSDDTLTGYYYSQDSIGSPRSIVLLSKLQELNPYVTIHISDTIDKNQNVTILINQPTNIVKTISSHCRKNNSKLIVLYSKGISGVIFVDAGIKHTITDTSGEIIEPVQIGEITQSGIIKCAQHSSHDFQSGDYITLTNLQGDNIIQLEKEWQINVINKTTFELLNFIDINPFVFINGTAIHVKKSIDIYHQTWSEQLLNPTCCFSFDLVKTYIKMYDTNHDQMPYIWSQKNKEYLDAKLIPLPNHARTFHYEIMPVVSLMGSIAASEAIKLVSNKYMPINQWFTWCDESLLPKEMPKDLTNVKTVYGVFYGIEFENKLINSKWFMVGSGAIGCEHLKNLAFMNVANSSLSDKSEIILTDPDSIEKSNLNRQFLFRSHHIGKSKSQTASEVLKVMCPNMKITAHVHKVGPDNIEFTNSIMNNVTGVLNALDNISARKFMDEQCLKYGIPLFESGTTATKGNTQPVIPFVTETYSASSDPEQEKSFPMCTIKSFPNEISHTIHWAMDQFEFFNRAPSTMNKWINNPTFLNNLSQIEKSIAEEDINLFTSKYPTQLNKIKECVRWAIDMFMENYNNSIVQLLHTFSPTHEVTPGILFWSGGKRCPKPIIFDINNPLHIDYIEATTHILARCSGLIDNFTRDDLCDIILNYTPKIYIPIEQSSPKDYTANYSPQEFEKDDDTNWHINWITASSNLRAYNYNIPCATIQQTKGIAGRIIPAISTTTAAVSGLILLEMLKYLNGFKQIELYRSTFINLAEPVLIYSEPIKAPMIDIAGSKINSWTKFEYINNSTLGEFKKYYEELFKINISMIVVGNAMIYADFLGDESLDKTLSDIILSLDYNIQSMVVFNIMSDMENIDIPAIIVNLIK